MARTKISEFSATPGNNTDIDGINIAEGCAPSGINDAIRELMSQLKDFQAGTAGDSFNGPVGTTTAAAGAFTTLSASSTVSGTGFSTYLASPPAIGGTAAAAGSFTTLSASSTVTLSGGTANGVLYLNGSKVATSGSALTFDGTTLYNSGNISVGGNSGGNRYVALLNETNTYTGTFMLQAGGGSAAYGGAVVMYGHAHASYPGAVYVGSSSGTSTGIIFGGGGNAGPATSEWMRLTSTGLGIGTSSPSYKLHVNGYVYSGSGFVLLSQASGGGNIYEASGNTGIDVGTTSNTLSFSTSGSTKMRLDSSGNLGLGVTPSGYLANKFVINTGTDSNNGITIASATNRNGSIWFADGTTGNQAYRGGVDYQHTTDTLYLYSGGQGNFQLDSSGNLGLGVTPSAWSNYGPAFQIGYSGLKASYFSTTNNQITLLSNAYEKQDTSYAYILGTNKASAYKQIEGAHQWLTAGTSGGANTAISFTQAMTLDASGNLAVGGTSVYAATITSYGSASRSGGLGIRNSAGTVAGGIYTYAAGSGGGSTDILVEGVNSLQFYTNSAERARIDSSGNLLVGTTSVTTGVSGTETTLTLQGASSGKAASFVAVNNAGTGSGYLGVGTDNITYVVAKTNNALVFATNNTERARITSGGYFKLGGDTSLNRHEVWQVTAGAYTVTMGSQNGTAANCFGLQMYYSSASPNGTGNEFFLCVDNVATRMTVRSNGGIANYQANDVNLSDRREKTNFAPAKSYLETICAIPVQTFKYIDQTDDEKTLGVVAQDVQAVAPELVSESNWGTKDEPKMRLSIYQTDLQYALMKCIQELKAEVDSLKAQLKGA